MSLKKLLVALLKALLVWLDGLAVSITFGVTDPSTGFYLEGDSIRMNLKNTQFVDIEVKPKNRKGGPAKVQGGSFTAVTETSAFSVGSNPNDPDNPLKARVTGNPEVEGGDADVGVVRFEADADLGDGVTPITAELAVNVTPGDATILDIEAGKPEEQE